MTIHYSRGRDKFDNTPEQRKAATFEEFKQAILGDNNAEEKGKAYFCAGFSVGHHPHFEKHPEIKAWRTKDLARRRAWLPLDCDESTRRDFQAIRERLGMSGFGYTTSSHHPDLPRFRLVLELDRATSRNESLLLGAAIQTHLGSIAPNSTWDSSVYRHSQPVYLPTRGARSFLLRGPVLQVDAWIKKEPEVEVEEMRDTVPTGKDAFGHTTGVYPTTLAPSPPSPNLPVAIDRIREALETKGFILVDAVSGPIAITCPYESEHGTKSGLTATVYLPPTAVYPTGYIDCKHAHCQGRSQASFAEALGLETSVALDWIVDAFGAIDQEARRDTARKENSKIGHGVTSNEFPIIYTLEEMLDEFVFITDGKRVASRLNPQAEFSFADWAAKSKASQVQVDRGRKSVSGMWLASPSRLTVDTVTFHAGEGVITENPLGTKALNTWRPFDRTTVAPHDSVGLFIDHVSFLFGSDTNRYLDWLAHIEQSPGELPHTGWLHVATRMGVGRNWLASVLCRVWSGNVAPNLDLIRLLDGGFNGQLSKKVLAIVDEIREGGRDSPWQHAERLKQIITEEFRLINPKYGRQSLEFNATRWMLLSNHLSALPLDSGDRRLEVVVCESEPRSASYYTQLYNSLADKKFIGGVAHMLSTRDIRHFNPGDRALYSPNKKRVVETLQTTLERNLMLLLKYWPSDFIRVQHLTSLNEEGSKGVRRTFERYGIVPHRKPLRMGSSVVRFAVLRNQAHWEGADIQDIRDNIALIQDTALDFVCLDYLLDRDSEG